jgi:hypothetical protein
MARLSKHKPSLTTNLHSVPPLASSALQSMKISFSCEDFSEKNFASLINRARARRAREAINPI